MVTILVIDDHTATCQFIHHICISHGVGCHTATSAEEGIAIAREIKPSAIFIDLQLEGELNGWQAIQLIKKDPNLNHICVIAITAGDHLATAIKAGSDQYLRKPFSVQDVLNAISQVNT